MDESQNSFDERKKPDIKDYVLYDSISVKSQRRQNLSVVAENENN